MSSEIARVNAKRKSFATPTSSREKIPRRSTGSSSSSHHFSSGSGSSSSAASSFRHSRPSSSSTTPTSSRHYGDHEETYLMTHSHSMIHKPRPSPLPPIHFADGTKVWALMVEMDLKYQRSSDLFKGHPSLSPQMRAILLDWIMDVCEAYKLCRETLYLTMDYLDRYLSLQENILKQQLQLIGITCLFIASKVEEIYPPKLEIFSYVTDGACTSSEILGMEPVVMKTLGWRLTPVTPATWVNIFLQLLSVSPCNTRSCDVLRSERFNRTLEPSDSRLINSQYAGVDFVRTMRLIDLASLDLASLDFTYATLAASALYHTKGRSASLNVTGFKWDMISKCANWMAPFARVCKQMDDVPDVLPSIDTKDDESRHLIQSHSVNLPMLTEVHQSMSTSQLFSPMTNTDAFLTPPRSTEKLRGRLHYGDLQH